MIATLREKIKALLTAHDSPHDIALAFAVGMFIGFSPLIGLHTVMAAGVVWAFRMNPIAVFTGTYINNPWTFVPLYGPCLWLGSMIWSPEQSLPPIALDGMTLLTFLTQFKPYLMPFVVGSLVGGTIMALASYVGIKAVVVAYRRQRKSGSDG